MGLSELLAYVTANAQELWAATLPTSKPATAGVAWNNGGIVSIA